MEQVSLSEVELYYSPKTSDKKIFLEGGEFHHIKNVMRHKLGDEIYVTDGVGHLYKTEITIISSKDLTCRILERNEYPNQLNNFTFCIPRLKSAERFEFALEKCVELGITNFIVFESARTIAKGEKIARWQKVLLSAMKQSLRAWLPKISYVKSFSELMKREGEKIIFDQNSENHFKNFLSTFDSRLSTFNYFIFGPEGGLTGDECRMQSAECRVQLTNNRLRSETAIVTAAAILSNSNF